MENMKSRLTLPGSGFSILARESIPYHTARIFIPYSRRGVSPYAPPTTAPSLHSSFPIQPVDARTTGRLLGCFKGGTRSHVPFLIRLQSWFRIAKYLGYITTPSPPRVGGPVWTGPRVDGLP